MCSLRIVMYQLSRWDGNRSQSQTPEHLFHAHLTSAERSLR